MKCPYCAEEIKDAATFCRHCGHDLSFFKLTKPMLEAVSSLEEKITSLENKVENKVASLEHRMLSSLEQRIVEIDASLKALHTSLKDPRSREETTRPTPRFGFRRVIPLLQRASVVFLPAFVMFIAYTLDVTFFAEPGVMVSNPGDALCLGLLLAAPISAGIWVGIKRSGLHLKTYVFFGALIGVVAWTAILLSDPGHAVALYKAMMYSFADLARLSTIFTLDLTFDTVSTTILFVAGVLFGKSLRKWRSPSSSRDNESSIRGFAAKIVSPGSKSFDRITSILGVIYGPTLNLTATTLTFVGTILTLFFKPP